MRARTIRERSAVLIAVWEPPAPELPHHDNPLCPFCLQRRPKADDPACCRGWLDVRSW